MGTKFQVARGNKANLPTALTDGKVWLTLDDEKLYIDTASKRILINKQLEELGYEEIEITKTDSDGTEFKIIVLGKIVTTTPDPDPTPNP